MWVKVDDGFPQHPKVIGLSDRAFRAYMEGLCYSARYLTDGVLPDGFVEGWGDLAAGELLAGGLWRRGPRGGVVIHDYLQWNPTAAEARSRAGARVDGKRRGGIVRAQRAVRNADGTYAAAGSSTADPAGSLLDEPAGVIHRSAGARYRRSEPAQPAEAPAADQQASSPVPVPVPDTSTQSNTQRRGSLRVPDQAVYLLDRLVRNDQRWKVITPGALVKLAKEFDMPAVVTALGYCRESFPEAQQPYAYLRSVVRGVIAERGTR